MFSGPGVLSLPVLPLLSLLPWSVVRGPWSLVPGCSCQSSARALTDPVAHTQCVLHGRASAASSGEGPVSPFQSIID